MKILPVSDSAIKEAIEIIQSGGVIAHATETCYGFACDSTNADAVKKLCALKDRSKDQPVSALFPSIEEAKKWVEWGEKADEISEKYLPGALTIVLPRKRHSSLVGSSPDFSSSDELTIDERQTLGIRISSHPIAQKLAELAKVPLSTTSANLHGGPNPYSVSDITDQFSDRELQPDLILDSGILPEAVPSTVIRIKDDEVIVLRQGGVHAE